MGTMWEAGYHSPSLSAAISLSATRAAPAPSVAFRTVSFGMATEGSLPINFIA